MQLRVIKADGSTEEYLHTKIIGAINSALVSVGEPNIFVAERLAESITYFLYNDQHRRKVAASEVFSMVQVVLAATSYEDAAAALKDYQYRRQLCRRRIEVVDEDEAETMSDGPCELQEVSRWEKSRIVSDLMTKRKLDRQTARAVAAMVEEKILKIGLCRVSSALIKQLVLADTAAMVRAGEQLRTATEDNEFEQRRADMDIRFRQQQQGLCTVGF